MLCPHDTRLILEDGIVPGKHRVALLLLVILATSALVSLQIVKVACPDFLHGSSQELDSHPVSQGLG